MPINNIPDHVRYLDNHGPIDTRGSMVRQMMSQNIPQNLLPVEMQAMAQSAISPLHAQRGLIPGGGLDGGSSMTPAEMARLMGQEVAPWDQISRQNDPTGYQQPRSAGAMPPNPMSPMAGGGGGQRPYPRIQPLDLGGMTMRPQDAFRHVRDARNARVNQAMGWSGPGGGGGGGGGSVGPSGQVGPSIQELLMDSLKASQPALDRSRDGGRYVGVEVSTPAGLPSANDPLGEASDMKRQHEMYNSPAYKDYMKHARGQLKAIKGGVDPGIGTTAKLPHLAMKVHNDPSETPERKPSQAFLARKAESALQKQDARRMIAQRAGGNALARNERMHPGSQRASLMEMLTEDTNTDGGNLMAKARAAAAAGMPDMAKMFMTQANMEQQGQQFNNNLASRERVANMEAMGNALQGGVNPFLAGMMFRGNGAGGAGGGGPQSFEQMMTEATEQQNRFNAKNIANTAPDAQTAVEEARKAGVPIESVWPLIQERFPDAVHPNAPGFWETVYNELPPWAQNTVGWGATGLGLGPGAMAVAPAAIYDLLMGTESSPFKVGGQVNERVNQKRREFKPSGGLGHVLND